MSGENVLEIDPATLAAEAAAVDLPPETPTPGTPGEQPGPGAELEAGELTLDQAEALAASYEAAAVVLYSQAARIIAPNWNITPAETRELGHATAVALALWFPDQQLPPKYAALLALAGTAYALAESRRDPETGRLPPMKVARAATAGHQAPADEFEPGGSPFTVGGSGFSTAA